MPAHLDKTHVDKPYLASGNFAGNLNLVFATQETWMSMFLPMTVHNAAGKASLLLICEHASNFIPSEYAQLGLAGADLSRHIAYDPGALEVAKGISRILDAPLIYANISRLVIDLNRNPDDFDASPETAELTHVPGNQNLDQTERDARAHAYYHPFHAALSDLITARRDLKALISVHSFTRVFKSVQRPWHIGIIHDEDEALAREMLRETLSESGIIGDLNVPYAPSDRVFHTLARHKRDKRHGMSLQTAMIEIRNDLINEPIGQELWSGRLAQAISKALHSVS